MKYRQILPQNNIHHCPGCLEPYRTYGIGSMFVARCKHPDGFDARFTFLAGSGDRIRSSITLPCMKLNMTVSYIHYPYTLVQEVKFFKEPIDSFKETNYFTKKAIARLEYPIELDLNDMDQIKKKIKLFRTFN